MKITIIAFILALVTLLSCRDSDDMPDIGRWVDAETIEQMYVVEIDPVARFNPCKYLPNTGVKPHAITICNMVFVCTVPDNSDEYACLLVHEAWHVYENGKTNRNCIENLSQYGYEYMTNRYILGHSGRTAYLSIEEEKEANRRRQTCRKEI